MNPWKLLNAKPDDIDWRWRHGAGIPGKWSRAGGGLGRCLYCPPAGVFDRNATTNCGTIRSKPQQEAEKYMAAQQVVSRPWASPAGRG